MTDVLDLIPPGDPLARPDLAEQALEGLARAPRYARTEASHCVRPVADILSETGERIDQLLFGEAFDILIRREGRAFGRARRDGVVGWTAEGGLAAGAPLATRRVASVSSALPLNALVASADAVDEADLAPVGEFEADPVAVAERLLGRPHALGARSSIETDCSGLVQKALFACGLPGPRRAMDQAALGRAIDRAELKRGDLVVWPAPPGEHDWTGHAALMLDESRIIHASGDRGGVVIEPLAEVEARLAAEGFAAPLCRRL